MPHSRFLTASAIALTAILHLILAFVSQHHIASLSPTALTPPPVSPTLHVPHTEALSLATATVFPPCESEATYQAGVNAYIDLTPLQTLSRNICACRELGEFPSLAEVDMIPEARYAVDLLPLLSHHNRHHVVAWHLYCDGSYYKTSTKYEESCAMAIVVVGEVSLLGVTHFYLADVIAAELQEHDIHYVGSNQKGPDIAEAMAVHWACVWILCFALPPQTAVVHYDSTSAGKPAEGLYSAGPNIAVVVEKRKSNENAKKSKKLTKEP